MKSKTVVTVPAEARLLTVKQAAVYLGTCVYQVRQLGYSKQLPHIKLGKRFLIDRADLDALVAKLKAA